MDFEVRTATEANQKVRAFTDLFDSEPSSITIAGLFRNRGNDWIAAPRHDSLHVVGFKRKWIRVVIEGKSTDVAPLGKTFALYLY